MSEYLWPNKWGYDLSIEAAVCTTYFNVVPLGQIIAFKVSLHKILLWQGYSPFEELYKFVWQKGVFWV